MNLEDDLRAALQREPAPAEFTAKVLAKTLVLPFWRRPVAFAIAAGLVLTAVVPPAIYRYRRQQRGIEARDQLMAALSITRVQLEQVRQRIHRNTRHKL